MKTIIPNRRRARQLGTGLLLSSLSCLALASPCDSVLSSFHSGGWPEAPQYHPECFGSSLENAVASINQFAVAPVFAVSGMLANRLLDSPPIVTTTGALRQRGVAAATPGKAWNVWGNLTSSTTEQDFFRPLAGNSIAIDNNGVTSVIGGDYALSTRLVAGVSASFDRARGESVVAGVVQNEMTNRGYMIAPYLGYSLSKQLALDASLGWGQGTLSQTGKVSADADRWFAGVNLNYSAWLGNTQISGRLGYLHAEEKYGKAKTPTIAAVNGTDARNKIDQIRLGVQAGWWTKDWMPYVGLAYTVDVNRSSSLAGTRDPIGRNAVVLSLGANFFSLASGLSGGLAYHHEVGRSNSDNHQLVANVGIRF